MSAHELRATAARIRARGDIDDDLRVAAAALDAVANVQGILPTPRTFAQQLVRDMNGDLFPRIIDADRVIAGIEAAFAAETARRGD